MAEGVGVMSPVPDEMPPDDGLPPNPPHMLALWEALGIPPRPTRTPPPGPGHEPEDPPSEDDTNDDPSE